MLELHMISAIGQTLKHLGRGRAGNLKEKMPENAVEATHGRIDRLTDIAYMALKVAHMRIQKVLYFVQKANVDAVKLSDNH